MNAWLHFRSVIDLISKSRKAVLPRVFHRGKEEEVCSNVFLCVPVKKVYLLIITGNALFPSTDLENL
jgi:hypothetical protein